MPTLPQGRRDFESFLEAWSHHIAKDLGVDPTLAIPTIRAAIERLSPHLGHLDEDVHSGSVSLQPQALFNALTLAASLGDPSEPVRTGEPLCSEPRSVPMISREIAERYMAIPLRERGGGLVVAMADPSNADALKDLRFLTGMEIEPVRASLAAVAAYIDRTYAPKPDVTAENSLIS